MSRLAADLTVIARDLEDLGAAWALVGGLAVSTWCDPRLTRDIDVVVSVHRDQDAERLVLELQQRGYVVIELIEQEARARLATARLTRHNGHSILIDILFASSGIEPEIVDGAQMTEVFPGVRVPVAARASLIALKVLARDDRLRPQDYDDLVHLLKDATDEDVTEARRALALIEERGFHRQRDLQTSLNELIRRAP